MSVRTPKWLGLALTIFAGVALLAFAACGGDDDDDTDATNTPTGTSQSNGDGGDGGDGGDATETDAPDGDGGDGTSDDPFADLENLTGDIEQQTGTVSYDVTNDDGSVTTMTFYSEAGSNRSRFDTTDEDGNVTSFITNDDGDFLCESSGESCIGYGTSGLGGSAGLGFAQFFSSEYIGIYVAAAEAAGVDVEQTSETYAGVDADCFSWTDPEDSTGTGKLCFGGDTNSLLYEEFGDSTGTTKFEATSYSDEVSDSDFDLPYPVSTIIG